MPVRRLTPEEIAERDRQDKINQKRSSRFPWIPVTIAAALILLVILRSYVHIRIGG